MIATIYPKFKFELKYNRYNYLERINLQPIYKDIE